jgi:hypothetical protein
MRFVAALLIFLSACHVQKPDDPRAPLRVDIDRLIRSYIRAQERRNLGIALAGAGVAVAILGGVVIGFGATDPNLGSAGAELGGGIVTSAVGLVLAIPGVVLWMTGQDDMDIATWRRKQLLTVSW